MTDEELFEYRNVCERIIALATDAANFAGSGHAASNIDTIVAFCRRAHALSGHRMGMGGAFMDMPNANVFQFKERMQLENEGKVAAPVRGRASPLLPKPA